MSTKALQWVYSQPVLQAFDALSSRNGHRALAHAVLARLSDSANGKDMAFASYDSLARDCCISRRAAVAAIKSLVNLGLVRIQIRGIPGKRGGRTANAYRLSLEPEVHQAHFGTEGFKVRPVHFEPEHMEEIQSAPGALIPSVNPIEKEEATKGGREEESKPKTDIDENRRRGVEEILKSAAARIRRL